MKIRSIFFIVSLLAVFVFFFLVAKTQVKSDFEFSKDLGFPILTLILFSFFVVVAIIYTKLIEILLEKIGIHAKLDFGPGADIVSVDFYKIKGPNREFTNLIGSILINIFIFLSLICIFVLLFSFFKF